MQRGDVFEIDNSVQHDVIVIKVDPTVCKIVEKLNLRASQTRLLKNTWNDDGGRIDDGGNIIHGRELSR